ncbi:uncharacterized protein LOC118187378, partial [Stegodyphus dumicola]|uniref:uncharacterized protein LOC118187378 n=1 Tax=Stegodyphus dumicola TaxID=202533 RepID=UPI0015B32303
YAHQGLRHPSCIIEGVRQHQYEACLKTPRRLWDSNFTLDQEECEASATNTINHHFLLPAPSSDSTNSEMTDPPREEMNEGLIETIKSVMKGITLPTSNLPQWAHLVPEEEWKAALLSEMHSRKLHCSKDCENNCTPLSEKDNEPDDRTDVLR